jgi:HK97 family phage major capsid protein
MLTVIQLRELAAEKAEEAREIMEKAESEGRSLTEMEAENFDKANAESERLQQQADRKERLERNEAKLGDVQDRVTTPVVASGERIEAPTGVKLYRSGELRAFKGPKAEINAYRAGRWIMATLLNDERSKQWCRDNGVEMRVQVEGTNAGGGFLVPDEMERSVIDLRDQYGVFRRIARRAPMSSDHQTIPRRSGGVQAYFIGEQTAITESDKSWNQVELTAKKLAALTRLSSDLSEDAVINVADDLAEEMAWAFAKKEDECALDGDGTSTYGGMVGMRVKFVDGNHEAGQQDGTSPCTSWAHITIDDELSGLMSLLPQYAWTRAQWLINPKGKAGGLDRLAMAAGGNTTREIAEGAKPMFGGYPVEMSAAMPADPTNGTVAALFGDFSLSTSFGDRRGITVKTTKDRYIEYDQIGIQATERFCVVTHDIGDGTNAGPVVALIGTT